MTRSSGKAVKADADFMQWSMECTFGPEKAAEKAAADFVQWSMESILGPGKGRPESMERPETTGKP